VPAPIARRRSGVDTWRTSKAADRNDDEPVALAACRVERSPICGIPSRRLRAFRPCVFISSTEQPCCPTALRSNHPKKVEPSPYVFFPWSLRRSESSCISSQIRLERSSWTISLASRPSWVTITWPTWIRSTGSSTLQWKGGLRRFTSVEAAASRSEKARRPHGVGTTRRRGQGGDDVPNASHTRPTRDEPALSCRRASCLLDWS